MPSQTPFQTETRSARRRAEHGGIDPERRMIDASTHEVIPFKARRGGPSTRRQRPSHQDRSRSPANLERIYRMRETIPAEVSPRTGTDLAYRKPSEDPRNVGAALDAGNLEDSPVPKKGIKMEMEMEMEMEVEPVDLEAAAQDAVALGSDREGAHRLVGATTSTGSEDLAIMGDILIRESVKASDEQIARGKAFSSTPANVEAIRSSFEHITMHDRETNAGQRFRRTHNEQPVTYEESILGEAVWSDDYPFLKTVDEEDANADEEGGMAQARPTTPLRSRSPSPEPPLSDSFLRELQLNMSRPADEDADNDDYD